MAAITKKKILLSKGKPGGGGGVGGGGSGASAMLCVVPKINAAKQSRNVFGAFLIGCKSK